MEPLKTAFATIGVIALVAVAGFFIVYGTPPSEESSEAASSSDIKADLQEYADILNEKGRLYVNEDIYRAKNSNSYSHMLTPIRGSVQVNGLSLEFDMPEGWSETTGTHYIVPYHAIVAISY